MNAKRNAAKKAIEYVESGMTLGLGSGSTANIFVDLLGDALVSGKISDIKAVCTSDFTFDHAKSLGIEVVDLGDVDVIDLAVDGADEVDPDKQLIKGLGRALLREKMVEIHAKKFVVIVDDSKIVSVLGTKGILPVEIVRFAYKSTLKFLDSLDGCSASYWLEDDGALALTDNGNYLVKLSFENGIADPYIFADMLKIRPGVVEHGLFLDMATTVIVGNETGCSVMA